MQSRPVDISTAAWDRRGDQVHGQVADGHAEGQHRAVVESSAVRVRCGSHMSYMVEGKDIVPAHARMLACAAESGLAFAGWHGMLI